MIEAKELTKKFGDFAATDHVNFAVKRGEIFGLLGPNGAGKSTTFKMMAGYIGLPAPGCEVRLVPVDGKLEGGQRVGKSTCIAELFGYDWYLETSEPPRTFM